MRTGHAPTQLSGTPAYYELSRDRHRKPVLTLKLYRRTTMATNQGGSNKDDKQSNKESGNRSGNQGGNNQSDTSNRGFASMDPERQREIASEGGRAAHASGNAHEFTSEEAREAGKRSHGSGNEQSGSESGNKQSGSESGNKQSGSGSGSKQSDTGNKSSSSSKSK
jgi:hypothetical protein